MDEKSGPALSPVAEEPQSKPEDRRRALFAAAGERIYLIEKLQIELNSIRVELDKDQPSYPPKIAAPKPTKDETSPLSG